jgi:leader peptidase (prepilin peptidase) / N-methyltransferase
VCGVTLTSGDLIPLISYALNRRKCRSCGARINIKHPLIEAMCAIAGAAAMIASPDWAGVAGLVFGCVLIAIAAFDFEHFWLPDRLTGALALTGLAGAAAGLDPPIADRIIGMVAGFAVLWMIGALYKLIRKRDGLGGGDPKLLGAIGAWLGWQALPLVIAGASLMGICWTLWCFARGRNVAATDRLALGGLMAAAAFPLWLGQAWLAH